MPSEQPGGTSRERILAAAAALLSEDAAASLSVRSVAQRAGVSIGSLRHFFPTQRELHDAVMAVVYAEVLSDDGIQDRTVPARERLVRCLRQVLAPVGVDDEARRQWTTVFEHFVLPEPSAAAHASHVAAVREARRRVEHWLAVLAAEGAVGPDDHERHARFLISVVNGLAIERALPAESSLLASETETLHLAVDAVLAR